MNKIIEVYKQRHNDPRDVYKIKERVLSFDSGDEFYNYLETVDNPHNMGTHICIIGVTEYLLEIEPWMTGCIKPPLRTRSHAKNTQIAQQIFLKEHKIRLGIEPTEAGFLPTIKNRPHIREIIGKCDWLGISYALVKLDE